MSEPRVRVAILGGGFAGLYAASYLSAADYEGTIDVTLVSEKNHFTFTPLLAEVVAGNLGQEHVTFPYRVLARRRGFRFLLGRVEGLDPARNVAHTTSGPVHFDYAVLALGARPRYFGREELRRTSLPLTSVREAVAIRNRVLAQAERAVAERNPVARRRMLTFVTAGAGPAGIEAGSEIWHLLTGVLPRYYDLAEAPRVVIVDAGDRILRGWDDDLAAAGLEELRRRGIIVRLHSKVEGFDGRTVEVAGPEGGHGVEAESLVWTAGTAPATDGFDDSPIPRERSGHLRVDSALCLAGMEHVFAVGDAARLISPRTGEPYPPVAPIAISQGVRAAANIQNRIAGRPVEPYQAHHAGKIISLGNGVAFVDLLGFRIRSTPAWVLYRATYLLKLVGLRNKVRTGVTLALNRIFERDLSLVE
ncbi:MAG: NAD(P)/FAD-dependent oxidoreductase [Gemmatimonadota bacterium]